MPFLSPPRKTFRYTVVWCVATALPLFPLLAWVAFDKSEGVVKRHFSPTMLCSTVWLPEWFEDRSSETLTVNQLSADRSANHRYGHQLRP
jgi:hypothetical protein